MPERTQLTLPAQPAHKPEVGRYIQTRESWLCKQRSCTGDQQCCNGVLKQRPWSTPRWCGCMPGVNITCDDLMREPLLHQGQRKGCSSLAWCPPCRERKLACLRPRCGPPCNNAVRTTAKSNLTCGLCIAPQKRTGRSVAARPCGGPGSNGGLHSPLCHEVADPAAVSNTTNETSERMRSASGVPRAAALAGQLR